MTISFKLGIDSSDAVAIYPMWDYNPSAKKNEDIHRTPGGGRYVYTWGRFDKISFGVNYVSSEAACRINSWWGANTNLLWMEINSAGSITNVFSVQLANGDIPLSNRNKPYFEYFKGTLELESY